MTNSLPGEVSALTYAGTDLRKSDLAYHFEITRGLNDGRSSRGEDTIVPGLAGQIPRNRMKNTREIELLGVLMGVGATDANAISNAQDSLDALEALFADDRDPATLAVTARDGTARTILARPVSGGFVVGPEDALGTRKVSVALVSVVPDWSVEVEGS